MRRTLLGFSLLAAAMSANAGLMAGDVAIIGRINNGTPDSFAFAALADIAAGETIYFTDNGWTGTQFRGASATDGDGSENLLKWTAITAIAAGTIVVSGTSSPAWSFTTSGSVPGTTSGSFANLALSGSGDQIYAFQGPTNNPLFNPSQQLFLFDDTDGFENATSASTGNNPGLTPGSTAVTFNFASFGFAAIKASVLAGVHTKDEWLGLFADSSNWDKSASGTLPSGSLGGVTPVPVPAALPLFGSALVALGLLRRR